jgi:cathepsin A (carboxypeptidase C)
MCYKALDYLNFPEVMKAAGSEIDEYQGCNQEVDQNFLFKGDCMRPDVYLDIIELLDTYDLPVLIYGGDKDYICNWLRHEIYTSRSEWSRSQEFGSTSIKPYVPNITGEEAGQIHNVDKFTFLRLRLYIELVVR